MTSQTNDLKHLCLRPRQKRFQLPYQPGIQRPDIPTQCGSEVGVRGAYSLQTKDQTRPDQTRPEPGSSSARPRVVHTSPSSRTQTFLCSKGFLSPACPKPSQSTPMPTYLPAPFLSLPTLLICSGDGIHRRAAIAQRPTRSSSRQTNSQTEPRRKMKLAENTRRAPEEEKENPPRWSVPYRPGRRRGGQTVGHAGTRVERFLGVSLQLQREAKRTGGIIGISYWDI
ncbi:hypothetical protein B0T19DRAFT_43816 [Cercophora scortea]|uniref:Uncharacterized protein n=1 Tax=Cercophora scortea TaxID=314031 RepID=A0AAE0ML36_9PEZI|nr:hypothetical protein B0T19DRAFT_43816 [Cercophora scortea]